MWEAFTALFEALSRYFPGGTEDSHEGHRFAIVGHRAKSLTRDSRIETAMLFDRDDQCYVMFHCIVCVSYVLKRKFLLLVKTTHINMSQ